MGTLYPLIGKAGEEKETLKDYTTILEGDPWIYILSFLDKEDIGRLTRVSKIWKRRLDKPHIWKSLYERSYNEGIEMDFITFNGLWKQQLLLRSFEEYKLRIYDIVKIMPKFNLENHTGFKSKDDYDYRKMLKTIFSVYEKCRNDSNYELFFSSSGRIILKLRTWGRTEIDENDMTAGIWNITENSQKLLNVIHSVMEIYIFNYIKTRARDLVFAYSTKISISDEKRSISDLIRLNTSITALDSFFDRNAQEMQNLSLNMIICNESKAEKGTPEDWPILIGDTDPIKHIKHKIDEGKRRLSMLL